MGKTYIIAEIGQAHDGSLGILHSYIDVVSKTNVNAIKFQTHIADAESSLAEAFRINFSFQDKTRYDYWKRMEFSYEQWKEIKEHCENVNLEFISSPFSIAAVDLLEKLDVKRHKIGSGEVTNHLLLKKIASTGKPVILSSGMSNFDELDRAVEIFQKNENQLTILQCTSEYPTNPKTWGINIISEYKSRYKTTIGFSDHSGDIFACLAAAAMGAEVFEFHVVFHKHIFGPDSKASIVVDEVPRLVNGINQIRQALNYPVNKNNIDNYKNIKSIFEKSLAINKDLPKGHIIRFNDLEAKKPNGLGISASEYRNVLGKKIKSNMNAWEFINWKDIYD